MHESIYGVVLGKLKHASPMLALLAVFAGPAAGQRSELVTGRAYYAAGDFKKAAAHFQLAIKFNPNDAESYYWMGMSYQTLADIALPFGGRYNAKARVCLTTAVELAPNRPDYRRELFEFLLDPAAWSRSSRRQAAAILHETSESDPDYAYMRQLFESERKANSSADARLGRLFLAVPRAAYRVAEWPAAALPSRREAPRAQVAQQNSRPGQPNAPAECCRNSRPERSMNR